MTVTQIIIFKNNQRLSILRKMTVVNMICLFTHDIGFEISSYYKKISFFEIYGSQKEICWAGNISQTYCFFLLSHDSCIESEPKF